MNQQQIEELVNGYLKQAENGASLENPKLDFKREWYKLDTEDGKNEFIADTSAMANTFGLDGYIIIGYDEKANSFTNSPFSSSGMRDSSDIMNLISKKVDPIYTLHIYAVEYKANQLSVIHIPPSIAKPHMIRCHRMKSGREEEHRILVRRNTSNQLASRYDIELMYYDKKNIIPEYSLVGSFHIDSFTVKVIPDQTGAKHIVSIPLTIENIGKRPVSIDKVLLDITLTIRNVEKKLPLKQKFNQYILIASNMLAVVELEFSMYFPDVEVSEFKDFIEELDNYKKSIVVPKASIKTSTGQVIVYNVEVGKT